MIDSKYLRKDGGIKNLGVPQEIKTQWFIETAQEVHGNKYDYSKSVYTKSMQKLIIICPDHGEFTQTPNNHISSKNGCPSCGKLINHDKLRKPLEKVLQDFNSVHGQLYDYSQVSYINDRTNVDIKCSIHGIFQQSPDNHFRGRQGCPKCKGKNHDTLYLLKCSSTGLIKIGITKDLRRRIKEIGNVKVIAAYKFQNPRAIEARLHKQFKELNTFNPIANNGGTEFFQLSQQDIQALKEELMREVLACV